ncbi:MAG: hypothetical protein JJU29_10045 [Verrucomicrobia bacterium]|nr:hypothetical protein [Verrucomicrobiota bacterium]MCH8512297.1 hypothetical protein [Kiritimatiellia bacterium]
MPAPEPVLATEAQPPTAQTEPVEPSPPDEPSPAEWLPEVDESITDPLERLRAEWPALMHRCGLVQPMLERYLKDSWPMSLTDTTLVIGFDPEFAREIDQVRQLERGALRNVFQRVLGRSVHLDYTVMEEPARWSHHPVEGPANGAPDDDAPFDAESAGLNPRAWLRNDAVRTVLEAFHGDILDIQT